MLAPKPLGHRRGAGVAVWGGLGASWRLLGPSPSWRLPLVAVLTIDTESRGFGSCEITYQLAVTRFSDGKFDPAGLPEKQIYPNVDLRNAILLIQLLRKEGVCKDFKSRDFPFSFFGPAGFPFFLPRPPPQPPIHLCWLYRYTHILGSLCE